MPDLAAFGLACIGSPLTSDVNGKIGAMARAGIVVLTALSLLLLVRPGLWLYLLMAVVPGVGLALCGVGTQRDAPMLDWVLSHLATGTILDLPIAALCWWWLHMPASRPGTLE